MAVQFSFVYILPIHNRCYLNALKKIEMYRTHGEYHLSWHFWVMIREDMSCSLYI